MEQKKSLPKPGECIWCRIDSPEPGGYAVTVAASGMTGFLPSTVRIDVGQVVPTTFVCMSGEKALFTFAFTMGTSARVQHSTASREENAFSVWTDAFPKSISLRRAVDLVMPAISSSPIVLKLDEKMAREVFRGLEQSQFTGCMKIFCQTSMSRAALVLLNGRVVGSIYTRKICPDPYPFEIGIVKMLEDVTAAGAEADLEIYELPREIIISMSSLFLGYLDQPKDEPSKLDYADRILSHFTENRQTACLNLLDKKSDTPSALSFICNGDFKGTYLINENLFGEGRDFLHKVLENFPDTILQAHILPAAMTSDAVRFGFSFDSDQFQLGS